MTKRLVALLLLAGGFLPLIVFAADSINWTFYAPGAGGKIEGGFQTSRPDTSGHSIPHTLDDVRTGKSKYVTLASSNSMAGRWYCIGIVTYASPLDRQTHTISNVVGYIHDTGCAFNGTCSCSLLSQYCNGQAHPEKMDIAVGDFRGWGALTASYFVDRNNNSAPRNWQQIAGLPNTSSTPDPNVACGGIPQEMGLPRASAYNPNSTADPYSAQNGQYTPHSPSMMTGAAPVGSPSSVGSPSTSGQPGTSQGSGTQTGTDGTSVSTSTSNVPATSFSAAMLLVQPTSVVRGNSVSISWSSVGMSAAAACRILNNDSQVIAQANEGARSVATTGSASTGSLNFTMQCQTMGGQAVTRSASVTLR